MTIEEKIKDQDDKLRAIAEKGRNASPEDRPGIEEEINKALDERLELMKERDFPTDLKVGGEP